MHEKVHKYIYLHTCVKISVCLNPKSQIQFSLSSNENIAASRVLVCAHVCLFAIVINMFTCFSTFSC